MFSHKSIVAPSGYLMPTILLAMKLTRVVDQPMIGPNSHESIGTSIQGPSVIRVPDWVVDP